jgi:arylsulfatase A-like enzyme
MLHSPSRGAVFTGRYPHSNGLIGLAHYGFEYHEGVRTLPQILSDAGWYSALFGMQHETSFPSRLGFDEFDLSNSYCEYVAHALHRTWALADAARPGLSRDG